MNELDGKTCLITGATSGIGKETALGLARLGASLVIVGRDPGKTAQTALEIQQKSGTAVDTLIGDLSSIQEVRRMAAQFRQRHDRLHVLVNNAGAIYMARRESVDGLELTFALNHLSYFLLTNLLVDMLKASAPARIINVSSGAHSGARINFDDLQLRRGYTGFRAYAQSKLMNVLFTYELARRLEGSGVTVNVLHPGFVASNFGHGNGVLYNWIMKLSHLGAISPQAGARTSIYLAASPEVQQVSGKYFYKEREGTSSRASYDAAAARRLWEASRSIAGLSDKEGL